MKDMGVEHLHFRSPAEAAKHVPDREQAADRIDAMLEHIAELARQHARPVECLYRIQTRTGAGIPRGWSS